MLLLTAWLFLASKRIAASNTQSFKKVIFKGFYFYFKHAHGRLFF